MRHTLCSFLGLNGHACNGVKEHALAAVGLDLLYGRGGESVGLNGEALQIRQSMSKTSPRLGTFEGQMQIHDLAGDAKKGPRLDWSAPVG